MNELILEPPECHECRRVLGNDTELVIMCTVSPDPYNSDYGDMLPDRQLKWLNKQIKKAFEKVNKHVSINSYSIHYELNKHRNLHAHILISLPAHNHGYDVWCAIISKIFHKLVGRPRAASMIAAHTVWCDKQKYIRYVNKENVYPPTHYLMGEQTITRVIEWLI